MCLNKMVCKKCKHKKCKKCKIGAGFGEDPETGKQSAGETIHQIVSMTPVGAVIDFAAQFLPTNPTAALADPADIARWEAAQRKKPTGGGWWENMGKAPKGGWPTKGSGMISSIQHGSHGGSMYV